MKSFLIKLLFVGCICLMIFGCQSAQETPAKETIKVFYPPAPDIPRLQFLKSISNSEDLGIESVSGFEKFIVGEDTEKKDWIAKPYGIALSDGKLYICDVEKKMVEVLDLKNKTFGYLTRDRRLINPVNIYIDNGFKYVSDSIAGAVFVFGPEDQLKAILGQDLNIRPADVAVQGNRCYVTDVGAKQVVVLDINTGKELLRMGREGNGPGMFGLLSDLALDKDGNVYVTDKVLGRVSKFNSEGVFQESFGKIDISIHDFVRPKGIAIDRANRIWVVDAATEVAKVYNDQNQLLLFFGFPGGEPGNMNLPACIIIDYDNVDLFHEYFAEGAQIEFLVLVANQYGEKINVYGFGKFPVQEEQIQKSNILSSMPKEAEQTKTEDQTAPASE